MQDLPYSLMAELDKVAGKANPPVHLWHPENEKDIDMVIQRDGTWLYLGTPIKRRRLVHLFASVLRREGENYYLVTPVEKCRITVADAPFQVLLMAVSGSETAQRLQMTTDMGEEVVVDADHPLRMAQQGDEWVPYVLVRDGMEARVNRNVYYQLADLMVEQDGALGVWSGGVFFPCMTL
jgi:hypothetical protein